jgi:chaperonin GroES
MTGTASQVEWADQIRLRVSQEFDRVADAFRIQAGKQTEQDQAETLTVIAILEEKRIETMANDRAGYFIRDWQELSDQVRQLIARDPRYQAIKANRTERKLKRLHTDMEQDTKGTHNVMNIRPLYDRIVVKRIEQKETARHGIIIPDSAQEKPQEGEVIAVGHGKRLQDGSLVPIDLKAGDRVLFAKYSGTETKVDGTEFIVMREDDVLGVLAAR